MFAFMSAMDRNSYGHISPREVEEFAATSRIVDVRERPEFDDELGHIPGAELVPLRMLPTQAASWNENDNIVLVCRSGARSALAAALLARLGFKRIRNLDGGMLLYASMGLPVERTS
jgi:sulfur dioxygenase